jgi:hypothetical protein
LDQVPDSIGHIARNMLRPNSAKDSLYSAASASGDSNRIKMMRTLPILFMLALCVSANAQEKCDTDYFVTEGIFFHGSMECNQEWLGRPAFRISTDFTKMCARHMKTDDMAKYIKRGITYFDDDLKKVAHDAACKKLDANMTMVENSE